MQAQRPGVWALLNKWLAARRAREERRARLEAEEREIFEARRRAEEEAAQAAAAAAKPDLLRTVSDVAWRMLLIGVVAGLLVYALVYLSVVTLPVVLAVFITALLMPLANWLRRKGLGRGPSTAISIAVALVVFGGVLTLIIMPAAQGSQALVDSVTDGLEAIQDLQLPFGLSPELFDLDEIIVDATQQITALIEQNSSQLISGAWTAGAAVVSVLVGVVLIIALTVYFVHSGDLLMDWLLTLIPAGSRASLHHGGTVAYRVMGNYVRGVAAVGAIDAIGIGILLLFVLDPSLAIPLIVLTFIGAFLPIIGAFLSGLIAVLVTFVTVDWIWALIVLGWVLLIQQLESNVFAPRIYGQALELPSPIVLIAISIGAVLGSVPGMFLATPVAAVLAALLRERPPAPEEHGASVPDDPGPPPTDKAKKKQAALATTPSPGEPAAKPARAEEPAPEAPSEE
ncbi:AI-2E family transporter [Nocardiopsis flavescens]|uniref:Predicted PurR-regulated permease PerM n=1 Tax=Nocardiopsis flavescens TaxID=758803 RepID=A0A1M6PMU0_9ACTN|nr:AI-2E family transporter [Nocardiopsis flavescens]SHK09208.1 Predicted PurR-regulated permease PerM [Nocardiopsis flavescens]